MIKIKKVIKHFLSKFKLHKIKKLFKGFTVVELIVVIAIIVSIASIISVAVAGYINRSKDSRIKADISQIYKDVVRYRAETGAYAEYDALPNTTYSASTAPCDDPNYEDPKKYQFRTQGDQFIVYHKLCTSDAYWCVDTTGSIVQLDNAPDAEVCACISGGGGDGGEPEGGGFCGDEICDEGEEITCPGDCGGAGGGICSGTCSVCSPLSYWDCIGAYSNDCSWNNGGGTCNGTCMTAVCDMPQDQLGCTSHEECSWQDNPHCGIYIYGYFQDSCQGCEGLGSDEQLCNSYPGCFWDSGIGCRPSGCTGNDEFSCVQSCPYGCNFYAGNCTFTGSCSGDSSFTCGGCNGCFWQSGGSGEWCDANQCSGADEASCLSSCQSGGCVWDNCPTCDPGPGPLNPP